MKKFLIEDVEKKSIAHGLGIKKGDFLVSINNTEIHDVFDYRYIIQNEFLEVLIEKKDGSSKLFKIKKDEFDDLGITFETGLMDKQKACRNKCVFCFIDQLPKDMRETLYFKDDDFRLSFLQGNYVTLTNMKEEDLDRIIYYHLSPIKVSVHTVDEDLREFMLKNKHSKDIMKHIKKLYDAGIEMHFQVVLCNGINDKGYLDQSIEVLADYGESLSIVPVGLTKHRENLDELIPFNKEDCIKVVEQIEKWQEKCLSKYERRFVYAADEFYIKAELDVAPYENYEDFLQIENGVGMIAMFKEEFYEYLKEVKAKDVKRTVTVVTGECAYGFMKQICDEFSKKFDNININVVKVINDFFGNLITVSGLLTGIDIFNALQKQELGDVVLIPENAFKSNEDVFLDDYLLSDLQKDLGVKVMKTSLSGDAFIDALIGQNL